MLYRSRQDDPPPPKTKPPTEADFAAVTAEHERALHEAIERLKEIANTGWGI